jgi:hypothetical protein
MINVKYANAAGRLIAEDDRQTDDHEQCTILALGS